ASATFRLHKYLPRVSLQRSPFSYGSHCSPSSARHCVDPMGPHALCAHGLYGAVVQVVSCGPGLPYQVQFLKSAMKFVATSRSATQHAQLRNRLFSCRCNLHDPEIHQLHRPLPPGVTLADTFELMLFYLCKAPAMSIEVFQPKAYDAPKRWPRAVNDVNPFGMPLPQLCDALLAWAVHQSSGYGTFALIGAMTLLWQPFETQVLATPRVFQLATAHLQYALDHVPTNNINDLWAARFSARVYAIASNLIQTLARTDSLHASIANEMGAIAQCMQAYLPPMASSAGDVRLASDWFAAVCARQGRAFVPRGAPEPAPSSNIARGYLPSAWALTLTMRSSKCTSAGCRSETAPQESRVCAACGVARYCSTESFEVLIEISFISSISERPGKRKSVRTSRDDNVAWTRLIHDTESGRAVGHFVALCAQYQVDPALGHAFLVATGRLG
ncbi:hypothetical protein DFH08DRAFT_1013660, partial [Mycena albidolilacea]